ncbi:MAG: hypothetical protein KY468_18095 [Armatimonadetes bacterium]|nr:hypothetical protein [Armatimonadota bacterium]
MDQTLPTLFIGIYLFVALAFFSWSVWMLARGIRIGFFTSSSERRAGERDSPPRPPEGYSEEYWNSWRNSPRWHPTYRYDLARRYESVGEHATARMIYEQVVEARPQWAEPRYYLALAYLRLKDREKARSQYELLKTLDPELAESLQRRLLDSP